MRAVHHHQNCGLCLVLFYFSLSCYAFSQAPGHPPPDPETRPANGVSVTAPKNAAVRPDEAIQLIGKIRVQGEVQAPVIVVGRVDIGYYFRATVFNDLTQEWEEQNRFVIVRPVNVSGNAPAGVYGGRGLYLDFDEWVLANPNWREDTIYW